MSTIVVMGPTGSGQSTFINALVPPKSSSHVRVEHSLESETNEVRHIEWVNDDGIRIKLVDTPGFDDAREGLTNTDVLSMIATFLEKEYKAQTSQITGLIYMHRIGKIRMGTTLDRNLGMFYKLCGQESLKNVVIVMTMQGEASPEEGWRHEQELLSNDSLFKPLVDGGAIIRCHDGARQSASEIVNYLLGKDHATTQIVRELVHERKSLEETAAGIELQNELRARLQKHRRELELLEGELKSATTPLAKREIVGEKNRVEKSISNLNQQLDGLKGHPRTCEISPVDRLSTSASVVGKNLPDPDFLDHSSGSNGNHLSYATEVPGDRFCHPNDVEPVSVDQHTLGGFQPSSTSSLPFSESECVKNCSQLLHFANCVPSICFTLPTRNNIIDQTTAWTCNFASHVENSLGNAQSGHATLKDILRSKNPHELQNFANKFVNAIMATVDEWRSSHSSLEKAYHECQTSLRTEPGRLSWWLNGRKVRKRRYALLMVVGVMKLLLQDIMFAIDWWTNLYNVVKIWQDAACLLTSGRSFNDGLEYELVRPIHEIDSYCVGFQSLAERLRKIADNMAQDRRRVGDL